MTILIGRVGVWFRLFRDHIDKLSVEHGHVFLHESDNGFRKTDFEIETAWSDDRRGLVRALAQLYGFLLFIHVWVELADLDLFNRRFGRLLQND